MGADDSIKQTFRPITKATDMFHNPNVLDPLESSVSPMLPDSGFETARKSQILSYILNNLDKEFSRRENSTLCSDSNSSLSPINTDSIAELGNSVLAEGLGKLRNLGEIFT